MRKYAGGALPFVVCIALGAMPWWGCDSLPSVGDGADSPKPDTLFSTLDECPDDPNKELPGACGCGVPDTDRDGDGAADCVDDCPDNPAVVQVGAQIAFVASFDDPDGLYEPWYDELATMVAAAGDAWSERLVAPQDVTIEVLIRFRDIYTAHGGSTQSVFRVRQDGYDVYEQGVAAEIRTGIDANGDGPDASITVGINNLTDGRWWFDPDPWSRGAAMPEDRLDAFSTILHEMGHVLAYNGWRDYHDGTLPGDYQSTYDAFHLRVDGVPFFDGPTAKAVYGGPVPLTDGNICHVANRAPLPGSDLLDELMNGVADRRGWRRTISEIDWAILADAGLPVRAPSSVDGCESIADVNTAAARPLDSLGLQTGPAVIAQEMNDKPEQPRVLPTPPHRCGLHCPAKHR